MKPFHFSVTQVPETCGVTCQMKRAANWAVSKGRWLADRALGAGAGALGALAINRFMYGRPNVYKLKRAY